MARWQLVEAHYLNGYPPDLSEEGVEWEYKETDRTSGRERRKRFKVPFYCDAQSIVCWGGRGQPSDTVFEGNPTHSMIPLDAEAKEISAKMEKPLSIDDFLPGQFSASMLTSLEKQLADLMNKMPTMLVGQPQTVASSGVSKEEFEVVKNQLAELMAQNAELVAALTQKGQPDRRV